MKRGQKVCGKDNLASFTIKNLVFHFIISAVILCKYQKKKKEKKEVEFRRGEEEAYW